MSGLLALRKGVWHNPPPSWQLNENALTVETGFESDFWQGTLYGFHRDDGHALLMPTAGDFTAYITFEGEYETLYDQAGLMLRLDEKNWLKAGVEFSDEVLNMSVVVTRGTSDWSTVALASGQRSQRLRLTRLGSAVVVQFRNNANRWQLLRVTDFPTEKALSIGPMACSPKRVGFKAVFSEFTVGPAVKKALHDDSPAT